MNPHAGKIVLNDAISQEERHLGALDSSYAQVDGRGFPELLDFAVDFGALIRYYDLNDRPDGDWAEFFLADGTMLLAAIATYDAAALRNEYERLRNATEAARGFDRKLELLRGTFGAVLEAASRINGWLRAAEHSDDSGVQQRIIAAIDSDLRAALRTLRSYAEGAALPDALQQHIALDCAGFLPEWQIGAVCPDGAIYGGATRSRKIDHALPYLDPLFYAFFDFITDLQAFASPALDDPLNGGRHRPDIALYIAFVRLFANAQTAVNTISARYASFYDKDILREPFAGPLPDSAELTFTLAPQVAPSAFLPAGTLFTAGQDADGNTILFASDGGLTVTAATIASLRTLRVVGDPLFDAPRSIVIQEIPLQSTSPWETFGDPAAGTPASLGFALASPVLLLTGGDRMAGIRIGYDDPQLKRRLDDVAGWTGLEPASIFIAILNGAFRLTATSTNRWFSIETYEAALWDDDSFSLWFVLPPSAPALAPFAGAPDPSKPMIEFALRQEAVELAGPAGGVRVFPLSLLASMGIRGVEIGTAVSGLSDMTLENTDGPIKQGQPFPLFGASPALGSYLRIHSHELFTKTPESVSLDVTWFNLPPNPDGFKGWYRDYVIGLSGDPEPNLFDNSTFGGAIGVNDPGTWTLDESVTLFQPPAGRLDPHTLFGDLRVSSREQPPYYDPGAGALQLTLTNPPYAFGNVLYAPNVLAAVIADLPDSGLCQQTCLNACAPYDTAAKCIADCLAKCEGVLLPEDCLVPCLVGCADELAATAIERLLRCVRGCAGMADPHALRDLATTTASVPPPERGPALRLFLGVCRKLEGDVDCLGSCLDEFAPMIEAAASIYDAIAGSPSELPQRAKVVQAQLEKTYTAALSACMTQCLSPKKKLKYPSNPYLPMAKSVRVDYTARNAAPDFFHLLPFGGVERASSTLLPQFPFEATLEIGFTGLVPPQVLTLLVRMAPEDQPAADPPPLSWQYRSGDHWTTLDAAQVIGDTTNALQNSGVLTLGLPRYAASLDEQWLRAVVLRNADRVPRTAAIVPNVAIVTRRSGGETTLGTPLPAGTITASQQPLPAIATIDQPSESFGGRPAEDQSAYEIRLGERLRHKDRAVLGWDYERLVLERFPTVWRAQTLPAPAPGDAVVAIVPGPETQEVIDATAPSVAGDFLAFIESYLEGLNSAFVKTRVVNPIYVCVQVTATVQFTSGGTIDRLNGDLIAYLSPWTAGRDPRYYTEDEISDFVQTRPYVAALIDISFAYAPDPQSLTSYFVTSALQHRILEADDDNEEC
ncbi:MAG TPA: baseplate J/gp47 family protein [Thermoanaerobaculia bacterium]|jgi:hypothetical protein